MKLARAENYEEIWEDADLVGPTPDEVEQYELDAVELDDSSMPEGPER